MVAVKRAFRRRRLSAVAQKASPGSAPGLLRVNPEHQPSQLYVMAYGAEGFVEHVCQSVEEVSRFLTSWPVVWVNVSGLGNLEMIEKIGTIFSLDRLSLEDVLDTSHRPKVEYYEHYVFAIVKSGILGPEQLESEQVSLILKKNVVITFQEQPAGRSFEQVRDRIRRGTGKIRGCGTDYLYYALVDEVIDRYFPVLDHLHHQLGQIEERIMTSQGQDKELVSLIHHAKNDLLGLHRMIWPMPDIVNMLMREDSALITKATRTYLRDCHDHGMQANDLSQFYRDTATGLLNTFLAYEGYKTNEMVKMLTMVSLVFIPLTFIASIYGMNFDPQRSSFNMPELEWEYGYPYVLFMMGLVVVAMLVYFKQRGWLKK